MKRLCIFMLLVAMSFSLDAADPWDDEPPPWHAYKSLHDMSFSSDDHDEVSLPYIFTGCEQYIIAFFHQVPFSCMVVKNLFNVRIQFTHDPKMGKSMMIEDVDDILFDKLKMARRISIISATDSIRFDEYIMDGRDTLRSSIAEKPVIKITMNLESHYKFTFKNCRDIDLVFKAPAELDCSEKFTYPEHVGFTLIF